MALEVTREQLYNLIWSTPISTLSKVHDITEYSIRKSCKNLQVPIPLAGYWQKSKEKQERMRRPLSAAYQGEASVYIESIKAEQNADSLESIKNQIKNTTGLSLKIPDRLIVPDKLIIEAQAKLEEGARSQWNSGILHTSSGALEIRVSKDSISRALRIFDTLIKALRARGHNVSVDRDTYAIVYDQKIRIALRERTTRVPAKDNTSYNEYKPTGILVFQVDPGYSVKEFSDGKEPLEEQLVAIIAKLEIKAEYERSLRQRWAQERAIEEKRERIERELHERGRNELEKFKALIRDARRYQDVLVLRNFISKLEQRAKDDTRDDDQFKQYIEWAKKKIDWYDPYVSAEDDLLSHVDRDTLTMKKFGA
jgi:hypothetical protein